MNKTTIPGLIVILGLLSTSNSTAARDTGPSIDKRQIEQRTVSLFYEIGADDPYTGLIKETFPDGKPRFEMTVINGNLTGVIEWYPNGQKEKEATIDGSRSDSGHVTEWYENGQMKSDQDMLEGRPDGLVTKWDESGQILSQETYVNGLPERATWDEAGNSSTSLAEVEEALRLAGAAKAAVAEYWWGTGELPVDNQTAGLSPGSQIRSRYVASITVDAGIITVSLGAEAGEKFSGRKLLLTPMPSDGGLEWQCSSPDIDPANLPQICQ